MPKKLTTLLTIEKRTEIIKHVTILATYYLVVWGFYRFLFKLPEEIEETIIKPIVWLIPVAYFVMREKKGLSSLGFTTKKLFTSLYLSLALGMVFAIEGFVINYIKYGQLDFSANIGTNNLLIALGISFATAFSEEIAFRGYIFNRLWSVLSKEWLANIITSIVWAIIHIPVAIFWWDLDLSGTIGYLILTTIFGIGSSFVFARTKNVFSSIFLHVFWEWPIILFR
jgi:membrane protease YdiL (CAAX protease family)